jgi:hypothetical protein
VRLAVGGGDQRGVSTKSIGIHASLSGNRLEVLEPIRQGVREHFGRFDAGIATGLAIRHDHRLRLDE